MSVEVIYPMKRKLYIICAMLMMSMTQVCSVSAIGSISADEQKIIDALQEGVKVNKTTFNLNSADINAAKNYLASNELTSAQITDVLNQIEAAKSYIRNNNIMDIESIKGSHAKNILQYVEAAASSLNLNVVVNSDGTVSLNDGEGKLIYSSSGVIKKTGYDFSQTLAVSSVLVCCLFAAGICSRSLYREKRESEEAQLQLC